MYQIEVEPNAEGKLIIELYGDKYEIVVKEPKPKAKKVEQKANKKEGKTALFSVAKNT